jgi:hypothetical protein
MRKVLLATTALVAMNVTAAQADISIAGSIEQKYVSGDASDTMSTDGNITITGSMTSDTGLTFTVVQNNSIQQVAGAEGDTTNGVEDAYVSVSSPEMGTIQLGAGDDIFDRMDGALGENNDIESQGLQSGASTDIGGAAQAINYMSPSIGGLQVGVYNAPNDDTSGFAATFSMAGASVYYGSKEDASNVGISASLAGFKINAGSRKVANTSEKASDIGVSYTLDNGIKIAALNSRGTSSTGTKSKYNNFGASYTLAPGASVAIENSDADGVAATYMALHQSWMIEKIEDTYININKDNQDCNFTNKWVKN